MHIDLTNDKAVKDANTRSSGAPTDEQADSSGLLLIEL